MSIQNPVEWGVERLKLAFVKMESVNRGLLPAEQSIDSALPVIRRIGIADLRDVLARGFDDFGANRTDVIFLCVFYPAIGLLLASLAAEHRMLPLLFPLISGFALVGPFAGVGLNEMSRRRELGIGKGWMDAFRVLQSPSIGAIFLLGLVLAGIHLAWLIVAYTIYKATIGPQPLASANTFLHEVFLTTPGHQMIVVGIGAGFLFAVVVLVISSVAFPLLLDRQVGIETAVKTSIQAARANPGPMAVWGMIIAAGLVIGSIPLFVGLIVILPVLGHSTWHLYRKMVVPR
jgi:uncharacterized membrane protein